MYCIPEKEVFWNEYMDSDVQVIGVDPFEVLLYKVIMGDTSDNIPKVKHGFGPKAFEKFVQWLGPARPVREALLVELAPWIAGKFSEFSGMDEKVVLGLVLFNLKMTWLNLAVYNEMNWKSKDGRGLLEHMLDDVNAQKDKYSYNKEYTLEQFYGMIIK